MRCKPSWSVFTFTFLLSSGLLFAQQSASTAASKAPKLCVAAVGNGSLKPIFVNEIQDQLVKELLAAGVNAEEASTASLVAKSLELSGNNRDSMRLRKCEFILLTVVDSAKPSTATPQPSAGTASGESVAGPKSDLLLSFALFRKKIAKPLLDRSLEAPQADTPTHSVQKVIGEEVEQVRQSLAKK